MVTSRPGSAVELDADDRRYAVVEVAIRDLKDHAFPIFTLLSPSVGPVRGVASLFLRVDPQSKLCWRWLSSTVLRRRTAAISEQGGLTVKRPIHVFCTATLLCALIVGVPGVAGAASKSTICTGTLAPGSYHRVVVPSGAVCLSDGPVTIKGGLSIRSGATFVLGSEENPVNTGTISGGVHATNAASVQIHFTRINGGVRIHGGSGPNGGPFDITWNAIEDNHINGGATVEGYNGFWFGFIRNHVNGSVRLNNNVLADPDGNEYVTNTIHGSLFCRGNSPAPQVGDSQGQPNQVTGVKAGQCRNL